MADPGVSALGNMLGDTGAKQKSLVLAQLIESMSAQKIETILVVGCGNGGDAQTLAEHFGCLVAAVDIDNYFQPNGDDRVRFTQMDATALKFDDGTFDLVFSFHALEHIPNRGRAILEMRRVLKPTGRYCIGTPNRWRAVGYIGVPGLAFRQKFAWNMMDWKQRFAGRFRNEYGAHAGFTSKELLDICNAIGPGRDISDEYYRLIYARYEPALRAITKLGLQAIAWPSVYIVGEHRSAHDPHPVVAIKETQ